MSLDRIRGQTRALNLIRRAVEAERLPHALLFSGPEGVGKRTAALELAKALNCAGGAAPDACDACPSCRLVGCEAHPDILVVAPEGGSRSLKIAQVREVERHAVLSPYAGRRKVALVDAAEAMTQEAANAFLKTLEEPPGGAVLILISSAPMSLLPTIRSRCQEVRFGPLPEVVVVALLAEAGIDPAEARRAADLGAGGVGQAMRWAERFPRNRQDDLLQQLWSSLSSPARIVAWADRLAKEISLDRARPERDIVPLVFLLLGTWARRLATGGGTAPPVEEVAWPGRGAVGRRAALALYAAVARAQDAVNRNANLRLTLEAMLLRMRAALGDQGSRGGPGPARPAAPPEPAGAGAPMAPAL